MKKLLITLLIATSLTGCAALSTALPASGIETTANTVTLDATKALTIATDAYTGVATVVTAAVSHGAFTTTQLQMIKNLNNQALALINGSDKTLTAAQRAASLTLIVTQLHSILGK